MYAPRPPPDTRRGVRAKECAATRNPQPACGAHTEDVHPPSDVTHCGHATAADDQRRTFGAILNNPRPATTAPIERHLQVANLSEARQPSASRPSQRSNDVHKIQ